MADFLRHARPRRSVLKRTRPAPNLPALVAYVDWLPGENKRRVIDEQGQEHLIADGQIESSYRLVTGGQAKKLLAQHWPELEKDTPKTVVNADNAKDSSATTAKAKPAAKTETITKAKATPKKSAVKSK